MELTTERLVLRPWRAGDEESLVRYAGSRQVWQGLQDAFPHPYTWADARAWIEQAGEADDEPIGDFAIVLDGEAVGGCGVHPFDDVYRLGAFIGYWLGEPFQGFGYATEAVDRLVDHAFETLPLERLEASVFSWNRPSQALLARLGFRLEGVLRRKVVKEGRLGDLHVYGLLREEWSENR